MFLPMASDSKTKTETNWDSMLHSEAGKKTACQAVRLQVCSNKPKGDNMEAQLSEYSIQRGQSNALCSLSHKLHCIITDAVACHSVALEFDELRVWNRCCKARRNTVGTSGQSETESKAKQSQLHGQDQALVGVSWEEVPHGGNQVHKGKVCITLQPTSTNL